MLWPPTPLANLFYHTSFNQSFFLLRRHRLTLLQFFWIIYRNKSCHLGAGCQVTAWSIFNEIDSSRREGVHVKSEEWCQVVGIPIIIFKICFCLQCSPQSSLTVLSWPYFFITTNFNVSSQNLKWNTFLLGQSEIKYFVHTYLASRNLWVLYK